MKKILQVLLKSLFFVPAILLTFFVIVLYSPSIPLGIWIMLASLWGTGFILSLNKFWGSSLGIVFAIIILIYEESLWMPISLTPYIIAMIIYYAVCGFLVFKHNKRNKNKIH